MFRIEGRKDNCYRSYDKLVTQVLEPLFNTELNSIKVSDECLKSKKMINLVLSGSEELGLVSSGLSAVIEDAKDLDMEYMRRVRELEERMYLHCLSGCCS